MTDSDITQLLDRAGRSYTPDTTDALVKVRKRAARHRQIRKRASVTVAFAVAAASATVGVLLAVPDKNPATAVHYLRIAPSVQLVAVSTSSNGLGDVYFADATDGIGMERKCSLSPTTNTSCSLTIVKTSNGGRTWTAVGQPLQVTYPDSRASYPFVNFATNGKDGWIYGSETFVTHNGGETFERTGPAGLTMDLSIVGNETWALSRPCPPGIPECSSTIYSTPTSGGPWRAMRGAPVLQYPYLQLLRTSAKEAFLIAQATDGTLHATQDGGVSWVSHPLPSPCAQLAKLTALTGHELWLLCDGPAPSDAQSKSLYYSVNAGKTWVLVATTNAVTLGVGTLPTSGIVTLVTSVAPAHLWIALDDGSLIASTDGGRTWRPQNLPSSAGIEQLTFTDTSHGWAILAPNDTLYQTSDGGAHWVSADSFHG
jgi:photosystem II stability/assembly factor-like uncharacterized protein